MGDGLPDILAVPRPSGVPVSVVGLQGIVGQWEVLKYVFVAVPPTDRDGGRSPLPSGHPSNVGCLKIIHPVGRLLGQVLLESTENGIQGGLPGVHDVSSRHEGEGSAQTIEPLEPLRLVEEYQGSLLRELVPQSFLPLEQVVQDACCN